MDLTREFRKSMDDMVEVDRIRRKKRIDDFIKGAKLLKSLDFKKLKDNNEYYKISESSRLNTTEVSFLLDLGFYYDYLGDRFKGIYELVVGTETKKYVVNIYRLIEFKTNYATHQLFLTAWEFSDSYDEKYYDSSGNLYKTLNYNFTLTPNQNWDDVSVKGLIFKMEDYFKKVKETHKETLSEKERLKKLSFTKFAEEQIGKENALKMEPVKSGTMFCNSCSPVTLECTSVVNTIEKDNNLVLQKEIQRNRKKPKPPSGLTYGLI